jgi:hypothetical protein
VLLLAVAVAVAVGGHPQFAVGHPIATTVQPDVTLTDKAVKAEHKFQEEMEEHLGPELLREGLQELWVTEVKQGFGKLHQVAVVAVDITVAVVAEMMVVVQVPTVAVAVAQDHL